MVVDMSTGFHFRPEGLGLLMAWNDPEEKPGFNTNFDRAFVEKILTRAVDRVPVFEELEVNPSRAWAGLYEMTPDHHPVLGAAPGVERIIFRQRIQRARRHAFAGDGKNPRGSYFKGLDRPDRC